MKLLKPYSKAVKLDLQLEQERHTLGSNIFLKTGICKEILLESLLRKIYEI